MDALTNLFNIWSSEEINPYLTDNDIFKIIDSTSSSSLTPVATTLIKSEQTLKTTGRLIFKSCLHLTEKSYQALFECTAKEIISMLNKLHSLHFIDCLNLTNNALDALIKNSHNDNNHIAIRSLETFELSHNNKITSTYFNKLINEALFMKGIIKIKFAHNSNINDDVLHNIIESEHMHNLVSINLKFCKKLTNETISKIHLLKKLRYLNISGCENIDDQGIMNLNQLIKLEVLKISNLNLITIHGIRILVSNPNCHNIQKLSMNYCGYLDEKVVEELMYSPYLNKLVKLSLKENKFIGYIGIYQILNHKNFENLQCLKIDNITNEMYHLNHHESKQYAKKFDHALAQSKILNNLSELYIPKILKLRKFLNSDKGKRIKKLIHNDLIEHHSKTIPTKSLNHLINTTSSALLISDEANISKKTHLSLLFNVELMILPRMSAENRICMVLSNQYFNNLKILKLGGLPNAHALIDLFSNQNFYELEQMSIINTNFTNKFYSVFSACLFPKLKKLKLGYESKPRQAELIRFIALNNCAKKLIGVKLCNFIIDKSDKKYLTTEFFPNLKKFSLNDAIVKLDKLIFLENELFQNVNISLIDVSFECNTKRKEPFIHDKSGIYKLDIDEENYSGLDNTHITKASKVKPYFKLPYDDKVLEKDYDGIQASHKILLKLTHPNAKLRIYDLQNIGLFYNLHCGKQFVAPIVKYCLFEKSTFDNCKKFLENLEAIEISPSNNDNIGDILENISSLDIQAILTKVKLKWNLLFYDGQLTSKWEKFLINFNNIHILDIDLNNSEYSDFLVSISRNCANLTELTIQYAYLDRVGFCEFCTKGKSNQLKKFSMIMCQNLDDIKLKYLQKCIFSKHLEYLKIINEEHEFSYAGLENFLSLSVFPNLYYFELNGFSLEIKDIQLFLQSFLINAIELKVEWDLQGCLENETQTYKILEIIGEHDISIMTNQLVEGMLYILVQPNHDTKILDFNWDWDKLTQNFVKKYWKALLEICESIIHLTTGANTTLSKKLVIILKNANHAEFMIDPTFLKKLVLNYLDDDLLIVLSQNVEIITEILLDYDFSKEKNRKITNRSKEILLKNLIKFNLLGLFLKKQLNFIDDDLLNFTLMNILSDKLILRLFKNQAKITWRGWKLFYEQKKKNFGKNSLDKSSTNDNNNDDDESPQVYLEHFLKVINDEAKQITKKSKIDSFIKKSTLLHYNKTSSINYNISQLNGLLNSEKSKNLIVACEGSQIIDEAESNNMSNKKDQDRLCIPNFNLVENSVSKTKVDRSIRTIRLENIFLSNQMPELDSSSNNNHNDQMTLLDNMKLSSVDYREESKSSCKDEIIDYPTELQNINPKTKLIGTNASLMKRRSSMPAGTELANIIGGLKTKLKKTLNEPRIDLRLAMSKNESEKKRLGAQTMKNSNSNPVTKFISSPTNASNDDNIFFQSNQFKIESDRYEVILPRCSMIRNALHQMVDINISEIIDLDIPISLKKLITDDTFKNIQKFIFRNSIFTPDYNDFWVTISQDSISSNLVNLHNLHFSNIDFDSLYKSDDNSQTNLKNPSSHYIGSKNFSKTIKKLTFFNSANIEKFFKILESSIHDSVLEELYIEKCELNRLQLKKFTQLKALHVIKCHNSTDNGVFQPESINLTSSNVKELVFVFPDKDLPKTDFTHLSHICSESRQIDEDYCELNQLCKLKVHNIELKLPQIFRENFSQQNAILMDKVDLSFNYILFEDFIFLMESPRLNHIRHFKFAMHVMQDKYVEYIAKKKFTRLEKLTLHYENIYEEFEIGIKQLLKSIYLKKLDWQRFYNKHKGLTNTEKFARIALAESDFYSRLNWFNISNLQPALAVKILHKITPEIFDLTKFFMENEQYISKNDQIFNVFINEIFYQKLYSLDIAIFTQRRLICKLNILQALLNMIMPNSGEGLLQPEISSSRKDKNISSLLIEYADEIDDQIILLLCNLIEKIKFSKEIIIKLNSKKHGLVKNIGLNNLIQRSGQNYKEKDIYNWVIIDDFWRNLVDGKSLQIISNNITSALIYFNNHLDLSKNLYLTTNGEYEIMKDIIENIELTSSQKLNQHNHEYLKKLYNERFDINNIEQDDICGEALLKIINKSPFLKRLTFSNKNFGDKFCEKLSYIIISRTCNNTQYINKIDLCNNPRITIIGKRLLYTALVGDTKIHMIDTKCDQYLIQTNLDILLHYGLYYTIQYNLIQYIQKIKKEGICRYHDHYCLPIILYSILCCPLALWQVLETPVKHFIENMRLMACLKGMFKRKAKKKSLASFTKSFQKAKGIQREADAEENNNNTTNINTNLLRGTTKFVFTHECITLNYRLKSKILWWVLTLNYLLYNILAIFCSIYFMNECHRREWNSYILIAIYNILSFCLEFLIFYRIKTIINNTEIISLSKWSIFDMIQSQIARFTKYTNLLFITSMIDCANINIGIVSLLFVILYTMLICYQIYKIIMEYRKIKEELYTTYINLTCRLAYNLNFLQMAKTLERFSTSSTITCCGYNLPQIVITTMITFMFKNFPQAILQISYLSMKDSYDNNIIFGLICTCIGLASAFFNLLRAKPSICTSEMILEFSKSDRNKLRFCGNRRILRKNALMNELNNKKDWKSKHELVKLQYKKLMNDMNPQEILSPLRSIEVKLSTTTINLNGGKSLEKSLNDHHQELISQKPNLIGPDMIDDSQDKDSFHDIGDENDEYAIKQDPNERLNMLESLIKNKNGMKNYNIETIIEKSDHGTSIISNYSVELLKKAKEFNSNTNLPKSKATYNEIPGDYLKQIKKYSASMTQIFFKSNGVLPSPQLPIQKKKTLGLNKTNNSIILEIQQKELDKETFSKGGDQLPTITFSKGAGEQIPTISLSNLEGQTIFNAEFSIIGFQKKNQPEGGTSNQNVIKNIKKGKTPISNQQVLKKSSLSRSNSNMNIINSGPNSANLLNYKQINEKLQVKQVNFGFQEFIKDINHEEQYNQDNEERKPNDTLFDIRLSKTNSKPHDK